VSRQKGRAAGTNRVLSYFCNISDARFIMRRVVRIVDDIAKTHGLDPLAHQALIQIFGTRDDVLVRTVAERLDISPTFASKVVKQLIHLGYVTARENPNDMRAALLQVTESGERLLLDVDEEVRVRTNAFTRELSQEQKAAAMAIFANHVGVRVTVNDYITATSVPIPSARALKV
jgi:DNA-binding MarR family transcriptional regulator